jgi:hypothetical protein
MMGPRNYYITHHTKEVRENGDVFRIEISDPTHRLYGVTEEILITRDGEQLLDHFREFEVITTGYFDQGMFDMHSNHHFIFCGFGRK